MAVKTIMKAVFVTNDNSESIYPLLKAAIHSLQRNTTLLPYVVWSGNSNHMSEWLQERGVKIVNRELSFKDQIRTFSFGNITSAPKQMLDMYKHYPNYYNKNYIETDSLRVDIPTIFPEDDYILYVDCDVLFLKDIKPVSFTQPIGAAMRTDFFNAGVLIMNIPKILETHKQFKEFYINSGYAFTIQGGTTQGAYNTFYKDQVYNLPIEINWHVYWKRNPDAKILHFCGPKPLDYLKMIQQVKDPTNHPLTYDSVYYHCLKGVNFDGDLENLFKVWNMYAEKEDIINF